MREEAGGRREEAGGRREGATLSRACQLLKVLHETLPSSNGGGVGMKTNIPNILFFT